MSIEVRLPPTAAVGEQSNEPAPRVWRGVERAIFALVCLVQLWWIVALGYGTFRAAEFVRGLM
jgi:hypothetical protein